MDMEMMHKLKKSLCKQISEYAELPQLGGKALEDVANMVKTVKNIDLIMEHEEGSRSGGTSQRGYSMGSYDHDDSSYRRGRDSMGRYTSREGASEGMRRSYDDEMKSMKDELRAMMEKLDTMR